MTYQYTTKQIENSARAVSLNLPVSTKHSINICKVLRGRNVEWAKAFLESVIKKKAAVPFKRFNKDMGHKTGMAAGRYPVKACTFILETLKSVESNASDKGLLTDGLVIASIVPQQASRPMRYGRQKRRQTKRTHVEIVVVEGEVKKSAVRSPQSAVKKEKVVKEEAKESEVKSQKSD